MTKKIKRKGKSLSKKKEDIEELKANLEKTGEALGDLFKGVFKGVSKILDVAQEMEKKGEETRIYHKEIKGITESGKEYQGEGGWKIGFLDSFLRRKKEEKKKQDGPIEKK